MSSDLKVQRLRPDTEESPKEPFQEPQPIQESKVQVQSVQSEPKDPEVEFRVVHQSTPEKPIIVKVAVGSVVYDRMKANPKDYVPLGSLPPDQPKAEPEPEQAKAEAEAVARKKR